MHGGLMCVFADCMPSLGWTDPGSVLVLLAALGLDCPHPIALEFVRQHSTSAAITLQQFVAIVRAALRYKR